MRLLTGAIAISAVLSLAIRCEAVGRMPGNTLQFLGWGYGAGYHAPIANAHAPVRRAVLHAPGCHWRGGNFFGHSHLHPNGSGCSPFCGSCGLGPTPSQPHSFEVIPRGSSDSQPQYLPPSPRMDGPGGNVLPPAPEAEGEAIPVPEASLPRSILRR